MKSFDFDLIIDRRSTASLKWEPYRDRDILPLWVADMDFKSPPAVIDALRQRLEHGILGYPIVPDELKSVVVSWLAERFDYHVQSDWLIWLPGLVSGLNIACRAICAEGEAVMTLVPVYPPFLSAPRHFNQQLITVELVNRGSKWEIDFDDLEKKITGSTRLFLLCNPQNPTGRVFDRQELERLLKICEEKDIIICSDEIHCDLVIDTNKKHIPIASLGPEAASRTITLMAPSKTFNIPGLGCSFGVISNEFLRRRFLNAMAGIVPEVNIMGIVAAQAAYSKGHDWLKALLSYLQCNCALVEKAVDEMEGLSMNHIEATYLAWIDARALKIPDLSVFFEKAGVALSDGSSFGAPGYVRLNFGCSRSVLGNALERIKKCIGHHYSS